MLMDGLAGKAPACWDLEGARIQISRSRWGFIHHITSRLSQNKDVSDFRVEFRP